MAKVAFAYICLAKVINAYINCDPSTVSVKI